MTGRPAGRIAIVGGTGRLGLGLARRLARAGAGAQVLIGSRDPARARAAAADAGLDPEAGRGNAEAAELAEIVILTVPAEAHAVTVAGLAPVLAGKIVVDTTLSYDRSTRTIVLVDGLSAAERAQRLVPGARVVAGFQTVSWTMLADLDRPLRGDVLLCGNDRDAKAQVGAVVRQVPMRPVDVGTLEQARLLEQLGGLLMALNRRYGKKDLGIVIAGLE
ncbi:MAG: NADPH-dependent F420 reductase [Armatimonadota bacterium]|nr:NADPH-dependent F420 reductase [Armatimonadota bacterium]MDR7451160.1 NADPH-dependent F420 reductase [Armatimonadota bacterium]MDR7467235.1 NADPH-dependent F420 reductase [Armatimonadota bacterium]MDR7494837.1 NADPH-dependent F420 reductase [Armatimonadota bacterium]MDR7500270.1 NADPH-dependent F420 reductase [Armatimonadota bacterium]